MTTFRILFFYFIVYSFLGWIIEGLFNLSKNGKFTKPNFLKLPLKPMYGFASTLLVMLAPLIPMWLFVPLCFIIPSFIEYLSAYLLDKILDLRYWNYEHKSYQFHGYVCLEFSCYWLLLSLLLIFFVQPYILTLYMLVAKAWGFVAAFIFLIVLWDFVTTLLKNTHRCKNMLS